VESKRTSVKTLSDTNHNLKRKYIKKQLDYKRVQRGEPLEEPTNFLEQMILDIKKLQERKALADNAAQKYHD